jgi:hypothetical protein
MTKWILSLLVTLVLLGQSETYASSNAAGAIVAPDRVIPFAKQVERELAERGALVAIVARQGRAPEDLPDGIEYTHVAFWVYSEMRLESGEVLNGYVAHNLYQSLDDLDRGQLVRDFPAEFFGETVNLHAGIIIPSPAVQERLLAFIESPGYARLFIPDYSLVANPMVRKYQNCTNFVLNALVGAIYQTSDPEEVQMHINEHFTPQKLRVNPFERLVGSIFIDGIATSDHGRNIQTATFRSLKRFMDRFDLTQVAFDVSE